MNFEGEVTKVSLTWVMVNHFRDTYSVMFLVFQLDSSRWSDNWGLGTLRRALTLEIIGMLIQSWYKIM